MNQILSNQNEIQINTKNKIQNISLHSSPSIFKITFWISLFIIFICIIFYFFTKYNSWQKEKLSKSLTNQFNIRSLYSNQNNYTAEKSIYNSRNDPFVIGLLKIDKINLMYPILSTSSEKLLEISPCRFYGPMPNEIGNLCIAGHNYANQKHFGKLSSLEKGDIIEIYDANGSKSNYIIYNKFEVPANDISCTNQNTNNKREVTLVTCNTIKGNRLVVKAKENR